MLSNPLIAIILFLVMSILIGFGLANYFAYEALRTEISGDVLNANRSLLPGISSRQNWSSVADALNFVVGVPAAIAGAVVAIIIAQQAYVVSRRQEHIEVRRYVDETVADAEEKIFLFSSAYTNLDRAFIEYIGNEHSYLEMESLKERQDLTQPYSMNKRRIRLSLHRLVHKKKTSLKMVDLRRAIIEDKAFFLKEQNDYQERRRESTIGRIRSRRDDLDAALENLALTSINILRNPIIAESIRLSHNVETLINLSKKLKPIFEKFIEMHDSKYPSMRSNTVKMINREFFSGSYRGAANAILYRVHQGGRGYDNLRNSLRLSLNPTADRAGERLPMIWTNDTFSAPGFRAFGRDDNTLQFLGLFVSALEVPNNSMKPLATFNVGAAAIAVLVLSAPTKKSLGSAVNSAFSRMGVDREERNLKAQVLEKLSVDGLIPMWLYESADQIARNPEKMVIFNGGNKED